MNEAICSKGLNYYETSLRGAVLRSDSEAIKRRGNPGIDIYGDIVTGLPRPVLDCCAALAYKTLLAMTLLWYGCFCSN